MKKILIATAIPFLLIHPLHAEESAKCIEESSEKTYTDAAIKCSLTVMDSTSEALFSANASPLEEDTPVMHTEIAGDMHLTDSRPWRAPNYSNQDKALGYSENVFDIPKGMEKQVQFWMDIYTKYGTNQGVIHDSENIDLVYEAVDFTDIVKDSSLSARAKEKAKQHRVDGIKKKYMAMLEKFKNVKSISELSDDKEKKIWKYFESVDEPNKFSEASQKNRMRFQLGQKDRMQAAIFFSGRYLEDMEKIFRDSNLPIELTRLVFVESSFNVLARSKVGASGLWQIMPYTARPYRYISSAVDNRNAPLEATKLATKLLRDNYRMLDSWPLAITGWNHGPAGVRKMTQSYQTRSIVELVENVKSRKSFGFASRNFYASFLAALRVERDANKYFDKVVWSQPLKAQAMKLPVSVKYKEVLNWFSGNDERLQIFNPHLTKNVRKHGRDIPAKTVMYVPSDKYSMILVSLSKKDRAVASSSNEAKEKTYKVAPGDTLASIAKEFGTTVKEIISNNEIESASKLLPGQLLKIPH